MFLSFGLPPRIRCGVAPTYSSSLLLSSGLGHAQRSQRTVCRGSSLVFFCFFALHMLYAPSFCRRVGCSCIFFHISFDVLFVQIAKEVTDDIAHYDDRNFDEDGNPIEHDDEGDEERDAGKGKYFDDELLQRIEDLQATVLKENQENAQLQRQLENATVESGGLYKGEAALSLAFMC